jgi:UDP-N-acetylglucosamine 2-epimerase
METCYIKPYIIALYHPHTKELGSTKLQTQYVLDACKDFCSYHDYDLKFFAPNNDPGSNDVIETIKKDNNIEIIYNLDGEDFIRLLANAKMIVGNSSCGIREASYLAIPSVMIGLRQENRVHADNVVECTNIEDIYSCMEYAHGLKCKRSYLFGEGNASINIVAEIKKFLEEKWKNKMSQR